jgi:hypothetical protein
MPTENRSSNTEMVSLSRDLIDLTLAHLPNDSAAKWELHEVLARPAPQPHPEPIAWMVGTAFWWTKEEAERDAAQTGLPMTPVGPLTGSAEVEQLREVIKHSDSNIQRQSLRISNQRAQLAERDALLTKMKALFRVDDPFDLYDAVCAVLSARAEPSEPTPQAVNGHRLCCKAVDDYRPGKCSCGVEIDHEIPGTSFQRLNALANHGE